MLAQGNTESAPAPPEQTPYYQASNEQQYQQPAPYQTPRYGAQRSTTNAAPSEAVPGTLNYVEGQVSINGQAVSQAAVGRAILQNGSEAATGNGYAEILLTPGAFLRLGHDSDVQMVNAGLADTRLQLVRGTAEVETDQLVKGTHLSVEMNGALTRIDKKGLYAFDAGQGSVQVLDGKATVEEDGRKTELGRGHQVLLASNNPLKRRSFDQDEAKAQPLYVWSRIRSQDLAKASYSAAMNADAYAAVNNGWFWNPYLGYYGFWPADAFLYSPFGWGFYSPMYFGFGWGYGGWGYPGYWGRPYYRGLYHGGVVKGMRGAIVNSPTRKSSFHPAVRSGGFHRSVAGGGFHGGGFHAGSFGGGFHGGGFHGSSGAHR